MKKPTFLRIELIIAIIGTFLAPATIVSMDAPSISRASSLDMLAETCRHVPALSIRAPRNAQQQQNLPAPTQPQQALNQPTAPQETFDEIWDRLEAQGHQAAAAGGQATPEMPTAPAQKTTPARHKRTRAAMESNTIAENQESIAQVHVASLDAPVHQMQSKRNKCEKYPCPTCGKMVAFLSQHLLTHTQERRFSCTYPGCGRKFKEKDHLTVHMLQHTGENPFPCPVPGCGRAFKQKVLLQNHAHIHTGQRYPCDVSGCAKNFTTVYEMHRHKKNVHGIGRQLPGRQILETAPNQIKRQKMAFPVLAAHNQPENVPAPAPTAPEQPHHHQQAEYSPSHSFQQSPTPERLRSFVELASAEEPIEPTQHQPTARAQTPEYKHIQCAPASFYQDSAQVQSQPAPAQPQIQPKQERAAAQLHSRQQNNTNAQESTPLIFPIRPLAHHTRQRVVLTYPYGPYGAPWLATLPAPKEYWMMVSSVLAHAPKHPNRDLAVIEKSPSSMPIDQVNGVAGSEKQLENKN